MKLRVRAGDLAVAVVRVPARRAGAAAAVLLPGCVQHVDHRVNPARVGGRRRVRPYLHTQKMREKCDQKVSEKWERKVSEKWAESHFAVAAHADAVLDRPERLDDGAELGAVRRKQPVSEDLCASSATGGSSASSQASLWRSAGGCALVEVDAEALRRQKRGLTRERKT